MPSATQPPAASTATATRAGLSGVLLLYFLGVILVITLAPFHFRSPGEISIRMTGNPFDEIANVLLFFPLGFLYPLTRPPDNEPTPIEVLGLGLVLSTMIETIQIFDVGRFSSPIDVLTNATGALLGAIVVRYITGRIRINAKHVGRLSLEIPLVGLIYLLLPLLLTLSMRAAAEPLYLLAVTAVVFIGTRVASSVQRYHFGPAGLLTNAQAGIVAAIWILLGTFPVLLTYRTAGASLVGASGAVTWLQASRGALGAGERRFEADALRTVRPLVVALVLCVVLLPLADGVGRWSMSLSLSGRRGDIDLQMLELLAPVAVLTVIGYMIAEARGRRELTFAVGVRRIAIECAVIALAIELVKGFEPGAGASFSQFIVTVAAGILGAGIYHNQRDHVRWILAHRAR